MNTIVFADSFHMVSSAEERIASLGKILRFSLEERDDLLAASPDADIIVAEYASVDERLLRGCNRLKGIVVYGVGVNHIDLETASAMGIPVANSRGGNAEAVAELSVSLMLECFRSTGRADRFVRSGAWNAADSASLPLWMKGRELKGKTLGILGPGAIGGRIADLGEAFGMRVIVWGGRSSSTRRETVPLDELLSTSDIVSVNIPRTESTLGLLSREKLSLMKKGGILIATSRGGIVDETALSEMLHSGHIGGAGLDVFASEPLPEHSPLISAPNTVFTPHMGGSTEEAVENISHIIADCCEKLLEGMIPETIVNAGLLREKGF
jgi:phosphoglycerate dehydrogenase-like enzyme